MSHFSLSPKLQSFISIVVSGCWSGGANSSHSRLTKLLICENNLLQGSLKYRFHAILVTIVILCNLCRSSKAWLPCIKPLKLIWIISVYTYLHIDYVPYVNYPKKIFVRQCHNKVSVYGCKLTARRRVCASGKHHSCKRESFTQN